jgi:hypothetical protein
VRLKHRLPTREEWAATLEAIGPCSNPAEYLAIYIREQRAMCARMQECVQTFKLGLGGENVADLLIAEVKRLRGEALTRPGLARTGIRRGEG